MEVLFDSYLLCRKISAHCIENQYINIARSSLSLRPNSQGVMSYMGKAYRFL